jgi:glycosyltransferase involved in cell wall biosynthesis
MDIFEEIKTKKNASIESNKSSIALFNSAINFLYAGKFKEAENYILKYKSSVSYDTFLKNDNRLSKVPAVSVIIVAYNTKGKLIECIDSLLANNDGDYEIVVVDNGGNGEVLEKLLNYNLLYIASPHNFNPSEGRNIGAYFSRGDILAFLDDDAIVEKNYINSIIGAFDNHQIMGLRGRIIPKTDHPNNKIAGHYDLGVDNKYIRYVGTEGNSAFRRREYIEIGGMNPLLFGHEGIELSYRIEKAYGSEKMIYSADTIIRHDYAHTNKKLETKTSRHAIMIGYLRYVYPKINEYISDFENKILDNDVSISELMEKNIELERELSVLRTSKSFQLGSLFFRSILNPLKIITFPLNLLMILFKKAGKDKSMLSSSNLLVEIPSSRDIKVETAVVNKRNKFVFVDSSVTWYGIAKQLERQLINLGYEPSENGLSVCYANDLGEIDPVTLEKINPINRSTLKRALDSNADLLFYSQKTCEKWFDDRKNAFYLPSGVDTNIFKIYPNIERSVDVGFVGKNYGMPIRNKFLKKLKESGNTFDFLMPDEGDMFFENLARFYNRCKIVVNDSQQEEITMRMFEATACGCLLITRDVPYLKELFDFESEIVTYRTFDEMIEKINYYLRCEDERDIISKRGRLKTASLHSYYDRASFIANKMQQYN